MSEPTITIADGWKDESHLQLIKNATQGLVEVGVMSEESQDAINAAVDKEMSKD